MKITVLNLFILSLASFRLTRLFVYDKITEFIRAPFFDELTEENEDGEMEVYYLPKKSGVRRFLGELLSCYWCTGIWAAAIIVGLFYLYPVFSTPVILILAVAGIAAILELIVQYLLEI
ncbi:DUF1360 domain-containing protein [Neobacillus vireti]|uniref:Sporulation protein n=1 Tax=Neobacillus vireti LMG 21834 TaxID=1131730 RepID=A0AB94IIA6_9BACI|nr:DUF1360 domain-containing protein [Neobacillus vireti]ETI66786.1 hypothetical protein BAVI_20923 [Neobacillus vireti LMG 21834]KLT19272.1 sporulation protein [Neobacillus vireti]